MNEIKKLQIYIPPGMETKIVNDVTFLLDNKNELDEKINNNLSSLTKDQLSYLRSLLSLEFSAFETERIDESLVGDPIFFEVLKYNIFESCLATVKQLKTINGNNMFFKLGLPKRDSLDLCCYTDSGITFAQLLEIQMHPMGTEITIYSCGEYNKKIENDLVSYYKKQGKQEESIQFWLQENKQKRDITQLVSSALMNEWELHDMNKDEKVKFKQFPWGRVYKERLYD